MRRAVRYAIGGPISCAQCRSRCRNEFRGDSRGWSSPNLLGAPDHLWLSGGGVGNVDDRGRGVVALWRRARCRSSSLLPSRAVWAPRGDSIVPLVISLLYCGRVLQYVVPLRYVEGERCQQENLVAWYNVARVLGNLERKSPRTRRLGECHRDSDSDGHGHGHWHRHRDF